MIRCPKCGSLDVAGTGRLTAVRDVAKAAGARPTFSERELDFAATLVGEPPEMDHPSPPFRMRVAGAPRTAVA